MHVGNPVVGEGSPPPALTMRLLGRLAVYRGGELLALPPSRKVRALMGYLATARHPVGRSRLCEMLGDIPNDPRGELRWCLSRLRSVLDEPQRSRVVARDEMVSLDLTDCFVDALDIDAAMQAGPETLDSERLQALCALFAGDFLEGLELNRSPQLEHWLTIQRGRYRACHAALLERLIRSLEDDPRAARPHAEKLAQLSPFDTRAQILLLKSLVESGQAGEAERHLTTLTRLYEAEGIDIAPVRQEWLAMRKQAATAVAPSATGATTGLIGPIAHADGVMVPSGMAPRRAALAVMPFVEPDRQEGQSPIGDGLTQDIITRLAKLRSLFVIASGSVFTLAERGIAPDDAAKRLDVDYFTTGTVRRPDGHTIVAVELVETRSARIVWSDTFDLIPDGTFSVLDSIGDMIVASIANEIEAAEKNRAILKPPSSLNAWEAYHRGLWHMYRFTKTDNTLAQQFFRQSSDADPTFARAFAGLSFTHWQSAFQQWADRDGEAALAFEAAGRSLIADDHDPAAHWAMGRALWLRSQHDQAVTELQQAVHLSPNFALGHYALSFVQSQSGDPTAAISASDQSRSLSPFDPLLFGMLGARAMAHVRLGQFEEAAEWALKAAARPNAHIIILAIAAHCLALAGRTEEGRTFATAIRKTSPRYSVADFLAAFRFTADAEALFRKAAHQLGLD